MKTLLLLLFVAVQAGAQPLPLAFELPNAWVDSIAASGVNSWPCGTAGVTIITKSTARYYKILPGVWFAPKGLAIWKRERPNVFFKRKKYI